MNVASWIILAIVIVWIGFAIRSAFFGGSKKRSSCHNAFPDDEELKLPSACAGCSKGDCSGCTSLKRNVPTPVIRELEAPTRTDSRRT